MFVLALLEPLARFVEGKGVFVRDETGNVHIGKLVGGLVFVLIFVVLVPVVLSATSNETGISGSNLLLWRLIPTLFLVAGIVMVLQALGIIKNGDS